MTVKRVEGIKPSQTRWSKEKWNAVISEARNAGSGDYVPHERFEHLIEFSARNAQKKFSNEFGLHSWIKRENPKADEWTTYLRIPEVMYAWSTENYLSSIVFGNDVENKEFEAIKRTVKKENVTRERLNKNGDQTSQRLIDSFLIIGFDQENNVLQLLNEKLVRVEMPEFLGKKIAELHPVKDSDFLPLGALPSEVKQGQTIVLQGVTLTAGEDLPAGSQVGVRSADGLVYIGQ